MVVAAPLTLFSRSGTCWAVIGNILEAGSAFAPPLPGFLSTLLGDLCALLGHLQALPFLSGCSGSHAGLFASYTGPSRSLPGFIWERLGHIQALLSLRRTSGSVPCTSG